MKGEILQKKLYLEKKKMMNYFKNNKLSLNKILNSIFSQRILRITYLGINNLKKMPEYNFSLLKFNIVLEDYSNYSVFIKLINSHQVKESLFCYWFFCEENYSLNTKFYAPKANIINYRHKYYEKKFEVQLLYKNNKIWKSSFVDIINLKQYINKNLSNKNINNLDEVNKFLFIAVL